MTRINLVGKHVPPEHQLIQKQVIILVVSFVASIILSLVWMNAAAGARDEVKAALAVEKKELTRLAAVKAKHQKFKKQMERRENILNVIESLQAKRVGPRPFLDYVNVVLPTDIWLTGISESDRKVIISGYSFSPQAVADFMRSLDASEHFKDVELSGLENTRVQEEEVKRFTISATWNLKEKDEEKK